MPGFGLSSRVLFPTQGKDIEREFCDLLNLWQSAMGLEKIIVMGHSFGAYVSCCYSMFYPDNVISLVLIDSWGFLDTYSYTVESLYNHGLSFFKKIVFSSRFFWLSFTFLIRPFLLTDIIRMFGFKYGPLLINRFNSHILDHFAKDIQNNGREICCEYFCRVNCFSPTGEIAFLELMNQYFMAKNPLINRINMLGHLKKLYFIFGKDSYLDCIAGLKVQKILENTKTYVHVIPNTSHLPHVESSNTFNSLILNVLKDLNSDFEK
uniref:Protein ABHD4 (Trinotate prediction) n=1 Tax=Myxobolus squamalis TaxID=59785 RepID=A0A6B2FWJ5_MYXSQ